MCHPLQQRLQSSICDNWLVFHITVEELWLTLLCGIVNSATLKGFRAWIDCSKSNVTGSQSDLSPDYDLATQNLNFVFFLSHSELNLLVCLGSLSCCITQVRHKLKAGCSPSGFSDKSAEFMVPSIMASRPGQTKAASDHHTTTTMFDCWGYDVFMKSCVGFMPDVTGHTPSKKLNFCHISPQNICPKVKQMWHKPLFSFCSAVDLALELSHGCWLCPISFLLLNQWGLQFFRCCSGFFYDLLDESLLRSWNNFGWPVFPGKVHH